jgi:DNA-binding NarL/FixJ family response regulator
MSTPAATSIMVLSSDRIFADALRVVLSAEADFLIVEPEVLGGEASAGRPWPEVDVIVIDAAIDRAAALAATSFMHERCESSRLLVVGLGCEDELTLDFIQAGAHGYVLQDASLAVLVQTIRALRKGQTFCSPRIATAALERISRLSKAARPAAAPSLLALTEREREILLALAKGMANKEIARELQITVQTVKNHVHHILEKLGVHQRREALRLAYELGLLQEPATPWTSFGP